MSSYLMGTFTVNKDSYPDSFAYLTNVSAGVDGYYSVEFTVYSDQEKTTPVYTCSSIMLPVASYKESVDEREIRALSTFNVSLATGMTLVKPEEVNPLLYLKQPAV